MSRSWSLVAAALAGLAVTPASASGRIPSPRLRFLGTGLTNTDGARYVARSLPGGALRVFDSRLRRSQRVVAPAGCQLSSLGGGQLLFTCNLGTENRNRPPILFDLATRAYHQAPPPSPPLGEFATAYYSDVGAHWLRRAVSRVDPHPSPETVFIDWRTGRVMPPSDSEDEVDDPNLPGLYRRLCSPLIRQRNQPSPDFYVDPFKGFQYEPPNGVAEVGDPSDVNDIPSFIIEHCGRSPGRLLCHGCYPRLGGGVLVWRRDTQRAVTVSARILRTGEPFRWALPKSRFPSVSVTHTAKRLYVSTASGPDANLRYRTYSAAFR